jgi:hypothetical protein
MWGAFLRTGRVALGVGLVLALVTGFGATAQTETPPQRDPNQKIILISDGDDTFWTGLNNFRVFLSPDAGMPGLGRVRSLAQWVDVPVQDYEVPTGLRIMDKLGHYNSVGKFIQGAITDEIKLSNGQVLRPGFYTTQPVGTFREFRPGAAGSEGHVMAAVNEKLQSNTPFLLEASRVLRLFFHPDFADRILAFLLSKRGNPRRELARAINAIRDHENWGSRDWKHQQNVLLSHESSDRYAQSKVNFLNGALHELSRVVMASKAVPHYLVMLENDPAQLREINQAFEQFANNAVFANPVVPILVNLAEPDVLARPGGYDWSRSAAEVPEKWHRVTVYGHNGVREYSNNLLRVLELILGVSPAEALALYRLSDSPMQCRDLLEVTPMTAGAK